MTLDADQKSPGATLRDLESPQGTKAHGAVRGWRAAVLIAATSLVMINNIASGIAITITLPTIAKELNIPDANLQWVVSAYTLTFGCFLLLFGRLADLHGRRTVWLIGSSWVGVWAIGCAFAPNDIALDVMRAFQGLGPAAAVPASLGILAEAFPAGSTMRTIAFGTFSSGAPVGSALGNVIYSIVTEYTRKTWRSAFYVTAGLSALTVILGALTIPRDTHHLDPILNRRVDWIGAFLVTSGLVLLTFVLGDGETAPNGWKTGYIIALLIVSIILLALFVYWEHVLGKDIANPSRPRPLLNLDILKRANGKLAVMQAVALFVWAGFSSWTFYASVYYQDYRGLSPISTMLRMLPMSITGVLCNVVVVLAVARVQGIILVAIGCLMTGLAPLLFALIDPNATYWSYGFFAAVFAVFGADFIFASGSIYVAKVSLPHEQSLAGGLFSMLTQIGTSLGLSIASVVLDRTITKKTAQLTSLNASTMTSEEIAKAALLAGYKAAQWLNFGFVMFGLVLSLVFLRRIGVIAKTKTGAEKSEGGAEKRSSETETDGDKKEVEST